MICPKPGKYEINATNLCSDHLMQYCLKYLQLRQISRDYKNLMYEDIVKAQKSRARKMGRPRLSALERLRNKK